MNILGLTTMTESAAVLLQDGALVAAAEQERFSRIKHDGGIPYEAIEYVLSEGDISVKDIDVVAVYWNPFKIGHRLKWVMKNAVQNPSKMVNTLQRCKSILLGNHVASADGGWLDVFKVSQKLKQRFGESPKQVNFVDHHQSHIYSCFYGSDFDEAAIMIMDGSGEAACTTTAIGNQNGISIVDEHLFPHSLGHFYSSITGYLGFKMLDGEYKLMGLSPYGDRSAASWIRENYLKTPEAGQYRLNTKALDYQLALQGNFRGAFVDHFGPARPCDETVEFTDKHRDIAASAQQAYEEVVLDLAWDLKKKTGLKNLAIAGGCGLNCAGNGQILRHGVFEKLYVPPVPNDAGGAVGAAMFEYHRLQKKRPSAMVHAQFGPSYGNDTVEVELKKHAGLAFVRLQEDELVREAAGMLADGKVICWFQGSMEYGPRALGNRSFLADPRSDGIRNVLNEKIKKRELFRPFAPSVKVERAGEYFEIDQASPFMTIIVPVRENAKQLIPAVTHVDGTARPQTVDRKSNPRYWKLLDEFESLTGVAVLLNTSFNIQEPIVCKPAEGIETFMESKADALFIEDFRVLRA